MLLVKTIALPVLLVTMVAAGAAAQDARSVVDEAARTMGAAGLSSIAYSGIAAIGNFGQSRTISFGLASTTIRNYVRTIDFTQPASHVVGDAVPPAVPGGPRIGPFEQVITPASAWAEQLEIWVTPWGFLRGAAANGATVRSQKIDGRPYRAVTWFSRQKAPSGQTYRLVGYINADNMVERVETWVEHAIFGDMHVEITYSNYRDVDGVKVPGGISQKRVGMEVFVARIGAAKANPSDLQALMTPLPREDRSPARTADGVSPDRTTAAAGSEKLADGVYRIAGGYAALAVELKDMVVVIGGGADCSDEPCDPRAADARGLAILEEAKRLFPNRPIRFIVSTHPHFDHAAVLPPFAAAGITILTDDPNRYFLEQALSSPRTLVGDSLANSRRKPKVEGVVEKRVLGDSTRSIELHHLVNVEHSDGMLVAYLPREKILLTADIELPAPGQEASATLRALVQNLDRLQIDFDRHVPVRPSNPDRPMTGAELRALVRQPR